VEASGAGKAGFADSPFLDEDTDAIDDICAHGESLSHQNVINKVGLTLSLTKKRRGL
jgi:predicted kinase